MSGLALKTGMRQGELLGLRWSDVDLEQAVVRVRRSYTGGTLSTPKNRERRDVDLISDVVELLAGWRREGGSTSHRDSLVFPGDDGLAFMTPSVLLRRQLYPAMAARVSHGSGRRKRSGPSTA
jgi:integrase